MGQNQSSASYLESQTGLSTLQNSNAEPSEKPQLDHIASGSTSESMPLLQPVSRTQDSSTIPSSQPNVMFRRRSQDHDEMERPKHLTQRRLSPPRLSSTFHRDQDISTSPSSYSQHLRRESHSPQPHSRLHTGSVGRQYGRPIDRYVPGMNEGPNGGDIPRRDRDTIVRDEAGRMRSPPARRSSPDRRYRQSPEPFRRKSSPVRKPTSPHGPPPQGSFSHVDHSAPLYKNMTWKKPPSKLSMLPGQAIASLKSAAEKQSATTTGSESMVNSSSFGLSQAVKTSPRSVRDVGSPSLQQTSPGRKSKVDFNGLKGVPTGPARAVNSATSPVHPSHATSASSPPRRKTSTSRPSLPAVAVSVLQSPYILITAASFEPNPVQVRHVYNIVHHFQPIDVFVDDAGYYIVFPDTLAGHECLDRCVEHCTGFKLFNSYTLVAQTHHNHPTASSAPVGNLGSDRSCDGSDDDYEPEYHSPVPMEGRVGTEIDSIGARGAIPEAEAYIFQQETDVSSPPLKLKAPAHVQHHHVSTRESASRHMSPLRGSFLHDKDDGSSSISGRTTSSDMSASRQKKCHTCAEPSLQEQDPLTQCSTCQRRYHRRCHPGLTTLVVGFVDRWQCRRCIKKAVPPVSQPTAGQLTSTLDVLAQIDWQPPTKRLRLTDPLPSDTKMIVPQPSSQANDKNRSGNPTFALASDGRTDALKALNSPTGPAQAPEVNGLRPDSLNTIGKKQGMPSHRNSEDTVNTRTVSDDNIAIHDGNPEGHNPPSQELKAMHARTPQPASEDEASRLVESSFENPQQGMNAQGQSVPKHTIAPLSSGAIFERDQREAVNGEDTFDTTMQCPPSATGHSHLPTESVNPITARTEDPRTSTDDRYIAKSTESPVEITRDPRLQREQTEPVLHEMTIDRSGVASPVDSVVQDSTKRAPAVPSMGKAKRTKSTLVTPHCIKCKKRFGKPASSTKEICPECKKRVAEKFLSQADSGGPRRQTPETRVQLNAAGSEKEHQSSQESALPVHTRSEFGAFAPATNLVGDSMSTTNMAKTHKGDSQTGQACGYCRKRHLKCSHTESSREPAAVQACKDCRRQHKRCMHLQSEDQSGSKPDDASTSNDLPADDPLDFWTIRGAETTSTADSEDHKKSMQKDVLQATATLATRVSRVVSKPQQQAATTRPGMALSPSLCSSLTPRTGKGQPKVPPESVSLEKANDEAGAQKRKRKRSDCSKDHGLGDSFERPPNTYLRLITMALSGSVDYRLQTRAITAWITDNIPGYSRGEGQWESGIAATLSMHHGLKGQKLWRMIETSKKDSETDVKTGPNWYELTPEDAAKAEHWDPVLKQPVSPLRISSQSSKGASIEDPGNDLNDVRPIPVAQKFVDKHAACKEARFTSLSKARAVKAARRELEPPVERQSTLEDSDSDHMDIDPPYDNTTSNNHVQKHTSNDRAGPRSYDEALVEVDELKPSTNNDTHFDVIDTKAGCQDHSGESSDAEPLSSIVKHRRSRQYTVQISSMPAAEPDPMQSDRQSDATSVSALARATVKAPLDLAHAPPEVRSSVAPLQFLIKLPARPKSELTLEHRDFSTQSLFEEWPEYEPSNQFDRQNKDLEIRQRPSRKQMFGKPALYSKLASNEETKATLNVADDNAPSDFHRSPAKKSENRSEFSIDLGETLKRYDNLDDFLGLPDEPMLMLHNQQLTFRDGTRDERGVLPRAKVYYKTGYA